MAFTQIDTRDRPEGERSGLLVETSTQIQRTMVVGLGGTGGEIIKRLKRRLERQGPAASFIRFLSLDTDVRTWLANAQFPALEPRERVPLSYPNPENVLESTHLYPTIQHLFHQGRKLDLSILADANGAGLMPVVGRTAFHLNAGQIYAHLQRALRDLQAIPSQPGGQPLTEEFRIYVVGSVAGGTGAGCFLETAVMIRHVFRSFKYQLIGILALPEAFAPTLRGQQLDAQSRGNAYAVLKELQYLQDGPLHWDDPDTYTFQFQIGGDTRAITLNEKPFHILYVIDHQNQEGGALRNLTDIYEMAAQQLSVEIGSPFGSKFASAQANDRAIMGLAPCPETGRPANISSLATAALVVPAEKLLHYCVRRYLRDMLQQRLLGEAPGIREEERAAAAWMLANGLQEGDGHRQISRSLLHDPRLSREVTGADFAFDADAVIGQGAPEFKAALASQDEHWSVHGLPSVRSLIEQNQVQSQPELIAKVTAHLDAAFTAGGVRGATIRRLALERFVSGALESLLARQREDQAVREETADRLDRERNTLARSGLFSGLLGKRRDAMRMVATLHGDLTQLEIDLAAGAAALRLLEAVRAVLEAFRRQLEALEGQCTRLLQTVEAELTQQQWGSESASVYALETEVVRAEHYPQYYERLRPASGEALLERLPGEGRLGALLSVSHGELAQQLGRAARALFADPIRHLNVVDVLQELYPRDAAFHLLDDLARRCRPFWTASPRGSAAFSDVFLIGSPGVRANGGHAPVQAEPLLQEWVDQHSGPGGAGLQSSPTYVALGMPGAIIFTRQTHGARLHYMRQILDYRELYRALQQQRGYPVHFKLCLEALPELRPDDEKATAAWALAVAYGMVAAKPFGWVWALDVEQRKDPTLAGGYRSVELLTTGSLWDLAVEVAPVEPREIAPHSSRFLHSSRSGALSQLGQRRDWVAAVERMVGKRLDSVGKQVMVAELGRYLDEVVTPRAKRAEEMEGATLTKEAAAIRRFLDRLNL